MALSEQDLLDAADAIRGQQAARMAAPAAVHVDDPMMADAEGMRRQQDGMFGAPSPLSSEVQQQAVENLRGTPRRLETLDRNGEESAPAQGPRGSLLGFGLDANTAQAAAKGVLEGTGGEAVPVGPKAQKAVDRAVDIATAGPRMTVDYLRPRHVDDPQSFLRAGVDRAATAGGRLAAIAPDGSSRGNQKVGGDTGSAPGSAGEAAPVGMDGGMQLSMPQYHAAAFEKGRIPLRDATQSAMRAGINQTANAEQNVARVQALDEFVKSEEYERAANDAENRRTDRLVQQDEHKRAVQSHIDKRAELSKSIVAESPDGSKFWKNPGSIMMAIGAALGGWTARDHGGRNLGMEALDGAIKQDLDLQQKAIDSRSKARGEERADNEFLLDKTRQLGLDENQHALANEVAARNNLITRMDAFAAKANSSEITAKIEVMKGQQAQKIADLDGQLDRMAYRAAYVSGGAPAGAGKSNQNMVVRTPGGGTRIATTEPEAIDLRGRTAAMEKVVQAHNDAIAIRKQLRADPLNAFKYKAQLDRLEATALSDISKMKGEGQVKEGEAARMIANVTRFTSMMPGSDDAIAFGRDQFQKEYEIDLNARAPEVGVSGHAVNAKGEVVPTSQYTGKAETSAQTKMPSGFKRAGAK